MGRSLRASQVLARQHGGPKAFLEETSTAKVGHAMRTSAVPPHKPPPGTRIKRVTAVHEGNRYTIRLVSPGYVPPGKLKLAPPVTIFKDGAFVKFTFGEVRPTGSMYLLTVSHAGVATPKRSDDPLNKGLNRSEAARYLLTSKGAAIGYAQALAGATLTWQPCRGRGGKKAASRHRAG